MVPDKKISVILVDDSSVIRGALSRILDTDPNIDIVSSVSNGQMAVTMAGTKKPDIIILDVEMPVMDGLTALPEILKNSPDTKVIMCSSLTAKGANTTMKAMALGAVECIVKPSSAQETGPNSDFHKTLITLVRTLGGLPPKERERATSTASAHQKPVPQLRDTKNFTLKNDRTLAHVTPNVIAIGSSTGGPQALFKVLADLKGTKCPILITQHMPATFTKILATHIEQQTGISTFEGEENMLVEKEKIYVAPGGKHMTFIKQNNELRIKLDDGPQENYCKPSVDPMLRSLTELYGNKILCIILTGMGHDGLYSARQLSEKGGRIIAQDEETSVVWGMPGAVALDGICSAVLPLDKIGSWVKSAYRTL